MVRFLRNIGLWLDDRENSWTFLYYLSPVVLYSVVLIAVIDYSVEPFMLSFVYPVPTTIIVLLVVATFRVFLRPAS